MLKILVLYFLLVASVYAQNQLNPFNLTTVSDVPSTRAWTSLEGKTADACNRYASRNFPDCQTAPDSAVTVLIPSASSPTGTNAVVAAVLAGSAVKITIYGKGFLADYTTVNPIFALGDPELGCSSPFTKSINDVAAAKDTVLKNTDPAAPAVEYPGTAYFTFFIPTAWLTVERELEAKPRPLCVTDSTMPPPDPLAPFPGYSPNYRYYYTGFKIGVVWNCDIIAGVSTCPPAPFQNQFHPKYLSGYQSLTFAQYQERANRKTCCKSNVGSLNIGQCIFSRSDNPLSPTDCCGGAQIEVATEKCCNNKTGVVTYRNSPCPCTKNADCPFTENTCCLPTKYPEFNTVVNLGIVQGECVGAGYSCCNTGVRYNPGKDQCCAINGVQSVNVPCPCATDNDCKNDADSSYMRCCTQTNTTAPLESVITCNAYANFPTGTGAYQQQRCPGVCFDSSYQICCNGIACIKNYEKCCNNTCCNRWSETCQTGRRSAAVGNRYNWNDFNVKYETCTAIEAFFPARAYFIILHPIYCLLMSLISTGICLIFANKASSRSYAAIEKAMIYIAVLTIVFDLIIYFSPAWKYGLFVLFVQCFTILTAATRVKKLNVWCLILTLALFIYLVDPFHGNQYLTLASSRTAYGQPDRDSAGLIHMIGRMFKSRDEVNGPYAFCQWWYLGYFTMDPQLRDFDRFDNPARTTYGYCDRGYILLLLVFCAAIYVCVFLQLILVLLALLLRFNRPIVKVAQE